VRGWPPITEPELLERLALDHDEFIAFVRCLAAALGRRTYEPTLLERALAYPWQRPGRSYLLCDGAVGLLAELDPAERRRTVAEFARRRHPLVAFGSNGAPETLAAKFAHFPARADRSVLVLAGDLHGFDVGASASPAVYGAMPAALFASPGTAVRAAVLWLTPNQVTQLTWSEVSYRLGRLVDGHFAVDGEADVEIDGLFAYVSRFGALCIDEAPVALAAIPATGRTAAAMTQAEVLDVAAGLVLGPGARAEQLVRAVFEDLAGVIARAPEALWPAGRALPPEQWTAYPDGRRGDGVA
jgi:hypothetical protein